MPLSSASKFPLLLAVSAGEASSTSYASLPAAPANLRRLLQQAPIWACKEGSCQPTCPAAAGMPLLYCEARPGDCSTGYCATTCEQPSGDGPGQPQASPTAIDPVGTAGPTSSAQMPSTGGSEPQPTSLLEEPTGPAPAGSQIAPGTQPGAALVAAPPTTADVPLDAGPLSVPVFTPPLSDLPEIAAAQEIEGKPHGWAHAGWCRCSAEWGARAMCLLAS